MKNDDQLHKVLINGKVLNLKIESVMTTKDDGRGGILFSSFGKRFFMSYEKFSFVS